MSFNEPIIYLVLSLALLLLSSKSLKCWRAQLFTTINLAFVALILNFSIISIVVVLIFLFIHYATLRLLFLCASHRKRSMLFWAWIAISLTGFVIVKQYQWITDLFMEQTFAPAGLITVGLSFIYFRQLSLVIEARDGALKEAGIADYINYNLAFWTFVAGPLQRFDAFCDEQKKLFVAQPVNTLEVTLGLNRSVFGFIKMFIVANAIGKYATPSTFLKDPDLYTLSIFLVAFPVYLYINFSGYCDIVIGIARAIGFRLPENFNHPYVARNLNDFWARWHITLSTLLRDYLYFPIQVCFARYIPSLIAMGCATIISFLVMGIWHGNSIAFAIFGLLHGAGVVIVNLYTEALKKVLSKEQLKVYRKSRSIRVISILICQFYVLCTFLPFNYSKPELIQVAQGVKTVFIGVK